MLKISDYVATVEGAFTAIRADFVDMAARAKAQSDAIAALTQQLQNAGNLAPADEALLVNLGTEASSLAADADTAAGKVAAPPAPPADAPAVAPAPVVDAVADSGNVTSTHDRIAATGSGPASENPGVIDGAPVPAGAAGDAQAEGGTDAIVSSGA